MLELKNITKTYISGNEKVEALKGISINFRKSEFVSILGQSGCGKTTLLNIIGGLDRYSTGDLIINGKSTKDFKDRNWDSYRNYSVGFVFQSYNLIPHQSVLANVELALTISGYSNLQKKQKAIEALKSVGLEDQIHKRPNQLSGGQMQRVAIARAIVNNPDIILADEPTGALDTKTSVQIMDLLKKISKDKLIVMVTHNPELAEKYSNRIVKLLDGKIIDDSNPYNGEDEKKEEKEKNKKRKTHMKYTTALKLSLNNLMTKKGRTILTSFAGSIGIIGIALILSLSSGVNRYITDIQKETMLSYPITIEAEAMDLSSILDSAENPHEEKETTHEKDAIYSDTSSLKRASTITASISKNNLTDFKKYLDDPNSEIYKYLGENGVVYSYDTKFDVYSYDSEGKLINSDGSTFEDSNQISFQMDSTMGQSPVSYGKETFSQLMPGTSEGQKISTAITNEYEIVYGKMPENYNEVVLVLDSNNEISSTILYNLGILPSSEYKEILKKLDNDEEINLDSQRISYEDICSKTFTLLAQSDYYLKNSNNLYEYVGDDTAKVEELLKEKGIELKITGIIKQKDGSKNNLISGTVAYTQDLTNCLINYTNNNDVVKAQEERPDVNVLNGLKFKVSTDEEKAEEAKEYISNLGVSDKAKFATTIMNNPTTQASQNLNQMMTMNEPALANLVDNYLKTPDKDTLVGIYDKYISSGNYDDNMQEFGKVSLDTPASIEIYTDSFEAKDGITDCITKYNETASEENKITYTDYVGLLMSSVTTIINAITYVLIAFVSISLVVSSIMIAIITYISVLERTKEIGILRAMGTSKGDVSKIFNAETFIEGLIAGLLGIGITYLLNIPITNLIRKITETTMSAVLPMQGAIILVCISILLTVIAGLIPSKIAAKKDPAVVLRSE